MKLRIHYDSPFYVISIKKRWWIFSYWSMVELSADFDYIEKRYMELLFNDKERV